VKPLLVAKGRQVGAAAMTSDPADLDRSTGQVTLHLGKPVTVAFLLTDAEYDVLAVRIVVQDPVTDAELYRSPAEIPLKLGV
jgi:hypothetical protein